MNAINMTIFATLVFSAALNLCLLIAVFMRISSSRTTAAEVRGDLRLAREEARSVAKEFREETAAAIRAINESLQGQSVLQQSHFAGITSLLAESAATQQGDSEALRATLDSRVKELQDGNEAKLEGVRNVLGVIRDTVDNKISGLREEIGAGLQTNSEATVATLERVRTSQSAQLEVMTQNIKDLSQTNQRTLETIRETVDMRLQSLQAANDQKFEEVHRELSETLKLSADSLDKNIQTASGTQQAKLEAMTGQLKTLSQENQAALDKISHGLAESVKEMRESNERKLEEMRLTVDEKLHDTLEKRLGESFKLVSERLETVHRGLGEMQGLASGVGDLRRMLTNVKVRGTWGEVQLGSILTDMLATDQFSKNVSMRDGSAERVEYAVRLPGAKGDPTNCVWLPIDSKFPQEDYARLQAAADSADTALVQIAQEALLRTIKTAAKEIHDKYINPPITTDFAILFLATEGLYAEVLREPGLAQELQTRYRVCIAGPTTLAALLNSLRVGFQTLAIEQRAEEVWRVLGAVKTEFPKFAGVLAKVQRQLQAASRTVEDAGTRTRVMERRLRSVEELTPAQSATILSLPTAAGFGSESDDNVLGLDNDSASDVVDAANDSTDPTGTDDV